MKKTLLILTLCISAHTHTFNYIRNAFFIRPSKTVINLRSALGKKFPTANVTEAEAKNLLNKTYNMAQFEDINYETAANITLTKNGQPYLLSQKDIDDLVNKAKYKSPIIPHWTTNTSVGVSITAGTLLPALMACNLVAASAIASQNHYGNIEISKEEILIASILIPLVVCTLKGAIGAKISDSALKFVARKADCKV